MMIFRPKPVKIIAELGINHNGDFNMLLELAKSAFENGADYVKLQTRTPEVCVPKDQWGKPRTWFDGTETTYIDYKNRMELSEEALGLFSRFVSNKYGANRWFTSVWDKPSVERAAIFEPAMLKIPSALMTDESLVDWASLFTDRLMISTGMSTYDEIETTMKVAPTGLDELSFLSCHSAYPSPPFEVDLNRIVSIANMFFTNYHDSHAVKTVGFSSHSATPYPAIYSPFFGAEYIEVHYTLDRTLPGTDHAASLEPKALRLLKRELLRIEQLSGDGIIKLYESEMPARMKLRGY
jgi:N-acetylneuraminate synthase